MMRKERMSAAGRASYEQWEHLRESFPDPQSLDYWCWLHTHGCRDVPEVGESAPPTPPAEVFRFSNTSDDWGYMLTAAATYRAVVTAVRDQNTSVKELRSILDFGCGPGRGLRLFYRHVPEVELHGTDVDVTAIRWCQENLEFAEFRINTESPSLSYGDAKFGLVFSISVYSHFNAAIGLDWLREIRRVLRPGGLAMLSVHGQHAHERATREPDIFRMLEVERDRFEAARESLKTDGFAFIYQPSGHLDKNHFGVSFTTREHVERHWTDGFELVEIREAAIDDWQDLVVLRRL